MTGNVAVFWRVIMVCLEAVPRRTGGGGGCSS